MEEFKTNILFCGKLEELCRFANMTNDPNLYLLFNLLCKGPMSSALISSLTSLSEEQITEILDKLCEEGLAEYVEKGELRVYIPKYIMEVEEFKELDGLARKAGGEIKKVLDRLINEHDEMIVKVFESKGGEYGLGSLVAQLTLKGLAFFLDEFRKELREEAESVAEKLSKQKS